MSRYIDVSNLDIPSDENDYDELVAFADKVAEMITGAPSIDIVRCKECKHNYNTAINHGKMQPRCDFADWKLTENDYCSRGERREP